MLAQAQATRAFGDISGGISAAGQLPPQPPSISSRITGSLELAQEIRSRLVNLNIALRGSQPSSGKAEAPKSTENHLRLMSDVLRDVLIDINNEVTEAYSALGV